MFFYIVLYFNAFPEVSDIPRSEPLLQIVLKFGRTIPSRVRVFALKTIGYSSNSMTYWWSGVVVSALASIKEVNLRRARLVLRWATVSGHLFGM